MSRMPKTATAGERASATQICDPMLLGQQARPKPSVASAKANEDLRRCFIAVSERQYTYTTFSFTINIH